jgi:xanthine dehydrogenase accessory factor
MESSQDWIEALGALRDQGRPCALVVVTATKGSAPRESGARMVVAEGRLAWGTIGGGNLEKLAIEHASALLARALLAHGGASAASVDFPLAEAAGQCCGGSVTLFFETFTWARRTIAIFGAGHVGQALAALAPWLKARVLVIDGRDEDAIQPRLPRQRAFELLCVDAPEAEIETLPADALVLVMTHSHALDLEIIDRALSKRDFPYLGLIGSERKWSRFKKRLAQRGHSSERLARVKCPIGVSKTSKDPAAIALAAAAELAEVMQRARA